MSISSKSLAGPGYIILNVIRVMNIIGLLAVCTASIVMLVKTFIVSKFFFFDAASHVITASVSLFLVASEVGLFNGYFARNWPLLSPTHGFVTLGFGMIVIGMNTLGNLNKEATSEKSLGLAFWRIVIGSGIIILFLGCLNIVVSYIFRDRRLGITARVVRSSGAVGVQDAEAQHEMAQSDKSISLQTSMASMSMNQSPSTPAKSSLSPVPTTSPTRTIFQQARASLLPSHYGKNSPRYIPSQYSASNYSAATPSNPKDQSTPPPPLPRLESTSRRGSVREKAGRGDKYHRKDGSKDSGKSGKSGKHGKSGSIMGRFPINISAPMNQNPRFAHLVSTVKQPDLAHHPSQRRLTADNPYELPRDF